MLMRVLVTFAVAAEFAAWRRMRKFEPASIAGVPFQRTDVGSAEVLVTLTGIGQEHATRVARSALDVAPDLCISSGLAGGLQAWQQIGDVLAPRVVARTGGGRLLRSDPDLLRIAVARGARPVALLRTADNLAQSAREKHLMGGGADAVDMESYAVCAEAAQQGVPAVAIRAISDARDSDLPYDFARMRDARGQIRIAALLAQILRHPLRLPALVRLARDCNRASESLAEFLDAYVSACTAWSGRPELSEVAAT